MLLSEYASNRDNNFNLLRFFAALFVLYTHSFSLTTGDADNEPLRLLLGMSLGDIAVDIFFITSGFLITSSYINRGNVVAFAWARILRIYPALITAVLFCVLIVGGWFTTLSISEYLLNSQTHTYLLKNMTLLLGVQHELPGVFDTIPWKGIVNGSLWTLPYEIRMYILLAFLLTVIICIRKKIPFLSFKNVLLIVGPFSVFLHIINHFIPFVGSHEHFIRLFSMFFIGAFFYIWREKIKLRSSWFFIATGALLLSMFHKDIYIIVYCITLPYILFFIVYVPDGLIRKFNQFGDYSYGMYIYTFPVQQSLVALYPDISIASILINSFLITLVLAMLSWHFVEKKFLKMKDNYRFIESALSKIKLNRKCSD
jgi:peptidoglycan/LPS O-acetylase OafA/YrhL